MTYERNRASAHSRGYSSKWAEARATFKQRHPWCLGCEAIGRQVRTEVVDHVVRHQGNQALFWDSAKWQPACRWHHDAIKPRLERMFECSEIAGSELWLNSSTAIALSKRTPQRQDFGADGWPA